MKSLGFLAVLIIPIAVIGLAPSERTNPDAEAIRTAVGHYFEGMMQADASHLRAAFHADARLVGVGRDGQAMVIPFERWAAGWEGREPRDPARHHNRIASLDISGNAAVAKTELVWPTVRYVDYLSLLEINGEWKIVNKIWTEERR